jgi:hypothetical protein
MVRRAIRGGNRRGLTRATADGVNRQSRPSRAAVTIRSRLYEKDRGRHRNRRLGVKGAELQVSRTQRQKRPISGLNCLSRQSLALRDLPFTRMKRP